MQSALGWKPSFCYNLANCYGARRPSIDENLQLQEKRNLKGIEQFSEETDGIGTDLGSQNSYEAPLPILSLALTIRGPVRGLKELTHR